MRGKATLLVLLLLLYLGCISWIGLHGPIGRGGAPLIAIFAASHMVLFLLWRLWPATGAGLSMMIAAALVARALMFPFPTGDDIHRYVWEGKIQNAGYNPYSLAPDAPELVSLRDANWEGVNHRHLPAIYPPATQLLFRACALVSEDTRLIRLVYVFFDCGILLLLLSLATTVGLDRKHIVLYALNPIVLLYVAGEGHLDTSFIFFLLGAVLAHKKGWHASAFLLLGTAVMFKIIPIVFAPLFVNRASLRKVWVLALPFLLALPYLEPGASITAMPGLFMKCFSYNGLLFSFYNPLFGHAAACLLSWITFAAAAVFVFFLVPDLFRASYLLTGAFLVCSPIVHPWYFVIMAPFLPFFRSPAWLLLLATAGATFATRILQYETGGWEDYTLARWIEYLPFVLVGGALFLRGKRTGPRTFAPVTTVTVVIPALNEAEGVAECVGSVRAQNFPGVEIVLADGGSCDGTTERVPPAGDLRIVRTGAGRGRQIAAGVREAAGDVILVLHADSRLLPGALAAMMERLAAAPNAVGGSFTARFENGSRSTRVVSLLDRARATISGISFGNQGQFFRRRELAEAIPEYALMEDVELSFRLKERGAVLVLPRGVINSARRWNEVSFLRNAATVVRLTLLFVLLRRFGLVRDRCRRFYRQYYGREVGGE
jgi:hypothetical protein